MQTLLLLKLSPWAPVDLACNDYYWGVCLMMILYVPPAVLIWYLKVYFEEGVSLPLYFLTYLLNYLFIPVWTHRLFTVFFVLKFNIVIIYFVAQMFPLWPLGVPSRQLPCSWTSLHLFWALPYFLASQDIPGSSCVFPVPELGAAPRPGSLHWRMVFRDQDLGARCTHC